MVSDNEATMGKRENKLLAITIALTCRAENAGSRFLFGFFALEEAARAMHNQYVAARYTWHST